jgi:hypothetical protein
VKSIAVVGRQVLESVGREAKKSHDRDPQSWLVIAGSGARHLFHGPDVPSGSTFAARRKSMHCF